MRKIVSILGCVDTLNLGDLSLLVVTINMLRRVFKSHRFYALCLSHRLTLLESSQNTAIILPAPFRISYDMNVITRLQNWLHTIKTAVCIVLDMIGLRCTGKVLEKSDEAVEVINRSEVVIFVGGDYISDTYGLIPLFMHFGNFILVRMYRKKIVFLGHSIGPFRSLLGKIMGFIMLQLVHGIIVRDKQSLSLAKRFGGRRTNVVLLPDLVFLMLNETNSINTRTNRSNLKIGIVTSGTICRLAPRHGLTQAKYLCILEHLANWLSIELNAIVYLIVCSVRGGESDLTPAKRLFSKIQNKENVSIQTCTRPEDAMRIFQELNLLISPRLHPILYALSIPIPVIGIDYNGKVSGAMKMFGLEPYVINLEEIGLHDLCKFVRKALSDNEIIREVIIKRKSDLIDADLYERSVSNVISME